MNLCVCWGGGDTIQLITQKTEKNACGRRGGWGWKGGKRGETKRRRGRDREQERRGQAGLARPWALSARVLLEGGCGMVLLFLMIGCPCHCEQSVRNMLIANMCEHHCAISSHPPSTTGSDSWILYCPTEFCCLQAGMDDWWTLNTHCLREPWGDLTCYNRIEFSKKQTQLSKIEGKVSLSHASCREKVCKYKTSSAHPSDESLLQIEHACCIGKYTLRWALNAIGTHFFHSLLGITITE